MSIFGIYKDIDSVLFKYLHRTSRLALRATNRYYLSLANRYLTIPNYLETLPTDMKLYLETDQYRGTFVLQHIVIEAPGEYKLYGYKLRDGGRYLRSHAFKINQCEIDSKSYEIRGICRNSHEFKLTPISKSPQRFENVTVLSRFLPAPYNGTKAPFFVRFRADMVSKIIETGIRIYYDYENQGWGYDDPQDWTVEDFDGENSVWGDAEDMFVNRKDFRELCCSHISENDDKVLKNRKCLRK